MEKGLKSDLPWFYKSLMMEIYCFAELQAKFILQNLIG